MQLLCNYLRGFCFAILNTLSKFKQNISKRSRKNKNIHVFVSEGKFSSNKYFKNPPFTAN